MTIAIGINFGTYVLLAVDTRVSRPNWIRDNTTDQRVPLYYEDDQVKIHKIKPGLITGAGIMDLLGLVEDRLQGEVSNTEQIENIVKAERRHYLNIIKERAVHASWLGLTEEQYIEYINYEIEHTGWILSYGTTVNQNNKLRLGMIHPEFGDRLIKWPENDPAVIWPSGMTKEVAKDINSKFFQPYIKPVEKFEILDNGSLDASIHVQHHVDLIDKIIRGLQPVFPSISLNFRIGIHMVDGVKGISSIMKATGSDSPTPIKWEWTYG